MSNNTNKDQPTAGYFQNRRFCLIFILIGLFIFVLGFVSVLWLNAKNKTSIEPTTQSIDDSSPVETEADTVSQNTVEFFIQVAMLDNLNGGFTPVAKWTKAEIGIKLINAEPSDQQCVSDSIQTLNSLLLMRISQVDSNPDVTLSLKPQKEFTPPDQPNQKGWYNMNWNENKEITDAEGFVSNDIGLTDAERCKVLRHELTHMTTGLRFNSNLVPSIFNDVEEPTNTGIYTEVDKAIIKLMYSSQIFPGMTELEVRNAFSGSY